MSVSPLRRPLWRIVERNAVVSRERWYVYLAGGADPFLFLFSVGIGVGALIDSVASPTGEPIPYRDFVAPGMLAAAAMNSIVIDSTINFYVRVKYLKTYDAVLATPLTPRDLVRGELAWSLSRVAVYSTAFLLAMAALGIIASPWAVLALPAAVLIGFGFGAVGMAMGTFMRSWLDFDLVFLAVVPMFLFSATFFPIDEYPRALQVIVQFTPLYQGADLLRRLILGGVGWAQIVPVVYLLAMGFAGLRGAERRAGRLLQP